MDRSILEGDTHSVIESMAIGGYATGASTGIVYIRAEYPLAIERLEIAIKQAREYGFLGKDIFGSGFDFYFYFGFEFFIFILVLILILILILILNFDFKF
jgi:NADH:ubiquinone oxidoreductase subunit F (NADH-binding)